MTSLCGSSMYINCLLFKQYTVLSLFIADLTDVLKCGEHLAQYQKNVVQIGNQKKYLTIFYEIFRKMCVSVIFKTP